MGPKCINLLLFELFSRTNAALKNLTFMRGIVKILTWRPSSERPVDQPTGLPREVQNRAPFWTAPGANFWRPLGPNGPFGGSQKPKKLSRSPPEAPKMTPRRPPQLRTRSGPPLDTILGPFWDRFEDTNQPTNDQPTNQPTNQTNQPTNQPTNQLTSQPTNQSTNQPANQQTNQATNQPTNQQTNQPTNQPTYQPTDQPTDQPTSQPTRQPTNQPTNQPLRLAILKFHGHSVLYENKYYDLSGWHWAGSTPQVALRV